MKFSRRTMIFFQGELMSVTEWAKEMSLSPHLLVYRLSKGWDLERAFNTPALSNAESGKLGADKRVRVYPR